MWTLRTILKIGWTAEVNNKAVLRKAELIITNRQLLNGVYGALLRAIMEGNIDKRGISRKQMLWLSNIRDKTFKTGGRPRCIFLCQIADTAFKEEDITLYCSFSL